MHDFTFYNPTKIDFGKDKEKRIGTHIKEAGITRILLCYGSERIKTSGLYDTVVSSIEKEGIVVIPFGGIVSNPRLSKVKEGISLAKTHNVQAIIGVGGGSVVDSAKAIAVGALYDGDVWDFFARATPVKKALPVFAVMTLAATGTEMNGNSVVTNDETKQKYSFFSPLVYPKVSVLNPELMNSVTKEYLVYSAVDIIAHAIETYFTASVHPRFNSRYVEIIVKTVMETTETLLQNPRDYDARAQFAWAATQALNGTTTVGCAGGSFPNHLIEHSLSALYDIAHGAGLAIVIPAWMRWYEKKNSVQFARFNAELFQKIDTSDAAVSLAAWFQKIGAPVSLHDASIKTADIDMIAENASHTAHVWGMDAVYSKAAIEEILHIADKGVL